MKRLLVILMSLLLVAGSLALAEEARGPLTLAEIEAFNEALLARGAKEELTTRALEDHYLAMGKGYELTLSSSDISDDSVVLGAAIGVDAQGISELKGPRGIQVGSAVEELLKAYPNDNPYLAGNQDGAVLYISGILPAAVYTAFVVRDGQAISLVEYNVYHQVDNGVARAGLQYTIDQGVVRAIRSFMTQEALSQTGTAEAQEATAAWRPCRRRTAWSPTPATGHPLEREDMSFGQMDFFDLTPGGRQGRAGRAGKAFEEAGAGLHPAVAGVEAVFSLDKDGKALRAERASPSPTHPGPRGLRLGQTLAQVISLFAHGDLPENGGFLYGKEQTPPYGSLRWGATMCPCTM